MILAIKIPSGIFETSLVAVADHPKLGKLLFFDPTANLIPFGQIGGYLQANYGLLVTRSGGELILLPKQPSAMNSIQRVGKMSWIHPGSAGRCAGDARGRSSLDRARYVARRYQRCRSNQADREPFIQFPFEFPHHQSDCGQFSTDKFAFWLQLTFEADNYAKAAGDLLVMRPRVLGSKSSGILETKEARKFPIEFDGPFREWTRFEITLPPGFEIQESPPPVDAEFDC